MAALQYAHARYISRSGGGSATRSAAYNGRDKILDERTQQLHKFEPDPELAPDNKSYRELPVHHAVLLPEGAPAAFEKPSVLWNAAEWAERRKNSQVAREILLALPNDPEVSEQDWIEMATTFAREHFAHRGLAVQLDIHNESRHPEAGKPHNPHAHLLISTRYVTPEGFGTKARDLHPDIRRIGGKRHVTEGQHWGQLWQQHQDTYFRDHGMSVRVEPVALVPRTRLRQQSRDPEALRDHIEHYRRLNAEAARDPANVLAALGGKSTERELDRFLDKHLPDAHDRQVVKAAVQDRRFHQQNTERISRSRAGRISARLDSRYNRGGGRYDEDEGSGLRR